LGGRRDQRQRRDRDARRGRSRARAPRLAIGAGINTGEWIVGNMGFRRRFDYTVIGGAVNLGSRPEALSNTDRVPLMIVAETARRIEGRFVLRDWNAWPSSRRDQRLADLHRHRSVNEFGGGPTSAGRFLEPRV
jgi:class 3 adenylate cyclase